MAANHSLLKSRRKSKPFLQLPKEVICSTEFAQLNAHTVKLLVDLGAQYNGKNNGDLCAAFSLMSARGWSSKGTLYRSIIEARSLGFLKLTRQGGRHKASLYALSFFPIDECKGKLDVRETTTAPNTWKGKKSSAPQ